MSVEGGGMCYTSPGANICTSWKTWALISISEFPNMNVE